MFAWMNAEALALTLETRLGHFWSRSRGRLWKKGEDSGNLLAWSRCCTDCDQDALWLKVHVRGKALPVIPGRGHASTVRCRWAPSPHRACA